MASRATTSSANPRPAVRAASSAPPPSAAPSGPRDVIRVVGARQHNLADVTVDVPKGRITAVTGVSGSGKSSLVFGTIAAESQRQMNDTYPLFVRNRLPKAARPDADDLGHLTPVVVVDQRRLGGNARSTVGTATDIAPLLRLLWARVASPFVGYSPAFSFNDPAGMCPRCDGLGRVADVDLDALLDRDRSLNEGAIRFPSFLPGTSRWKRYVDSGLFDDDKPLRDYDGAEWHALVHAEGFDPPEPRPGWPPSSTYEGVLPRFRRLYLDRSPGRVPRNLRDAVDALVTRRTCPACGGSRLNERARGATIDDRSICDCSAMEASELLVALRAPGSTFVGSAVAAPLVDAIVHRLESMVAVGLGYLALDRETPTLSGGESQRVKMVRHLGSSLVGLTYVLDEPSVGLHPHDVADLIALVRALRDVGNTVIVVEHDLDVIAAADHVIDLGPGGGTDGGRVVYEGDVGGLAHADTPTGRSLGRARGFAVHRRWTRTRTAEVTRQNLDHVRVAIPLGALTAVTGVAGSGKSTLVREALPPGADGVVHIDQGPLAGTTRSSVATAAGIAEQVRRRFAWASGARASLFSANSGGACAQCRGLGHLRVDLAFLEDVTVPCEACAGACFNPEALSHRWDGRTIRDVLDLTVADARNRLGDAAVTETLGRLDEVGLGYLRLGQPVSTLSGGERQRLKLAGRLGDERLTGSGAEKSSTERAAPILVLDEPTSGLHPTDVDRLVAVLDRLVDAGVTIVVVEHDLDVIRRADHVIDLGPGPGRHGGRIVASGTPEEVAGCAESLTGAHLGRFVTGDP